MHHDLLVVADAKALAVKAAALVETAARAAIDDKGRFDLAVSGGRTPWAMFSELAARDLTWQAVHIFQVDERVAPTDDPDRNLAHLYQALSGAPAQVAPMPVEDPDLDMAAASYGDALPQRLDLIHLGLGVDGHTASLIPGDSVLEVTDRPVAITGTYQGRRRMTLTYPGLARGAQLLWLVSGSDKAPALAKLLAGDSSIPAGRIRANRSIVIADTDATTKEQR